MTGLNGNDPILLTTARWCNRPQPKEDNPGYHGKIHAHTGKFTQYEYGTDTPFGLPGNYFKYPLEGDGPLQASVVCAPQTFVLGDDIDNPAAFAVSATGKLLSRDDAWCTRGDGFHVPVDCRGLDTSGLKQGPSGWGDIKWLGFLPFPGSVHYKGQPYAPGGQMTITGTWGQWRVTGMIGGDRAAEIMAATMADRTAFAAAKRAAREAARAAVAAGASPARVAVAARAAAVDCWHGQDATGTHREMLMELLWDCGRNGLTTEQAYAEWLKYSAPWDATRPWTADHFRNMWQDVPRKVAEVEAKRTEQLAAIPAALPERLSGANGQHPPETDPPGAETPGPYAADPPGAETPVEPGPAVEPGGKLKPRFEVGNEATAAEQLRGKLGAGPLSGVYLRDGVLVHTPRTGEDGYVMPTPDEVARGIDHGPAQVRGVGDRLLRSLVEIVYDVGKVVAVKEKGKPTGEKIWVPALFPPDAARHAVGAAELGMGCPNLRYLAGVTHTPVLRPDGTVLADPGHDLATGLLYLPDAGLTVPPVPEHPTREQAETAAALLRYPVSLFPWAKPLHHEANWLGAMFTPLLRLLLPPPYQMVVITATNSGSGKGYLMRMLGIVHGIATRGEFPREREELRKLIIATLHTTTAPVIGMDNIRGTIYSSELEALLTASVLTDRELGASRNITVTNDRLWVATGNNARIGGDLARRCLPVALDPRCARPHTRKFPFSPVEWMTANRGEYIAALLTVARGWALAGFPAGDAGSSDDYGPWRGALRGLLEFAGVPGTFGDDSSGDLAGVSEDDAEWGAFVAELHRVFQAAEDSEGFTVQDGSFTTADIIAHLDRPLSGANPVTPVRRGGMAEYIEQHQDDRPPHVESGDHLAADCLPGDLAEKWANARYGKTSGFARTLGQWLNYRDGRFTADGLTVRQVSSRRGNRPARFRVDGQE